MARDPAERLEGVQEHRPHAQRRHRQPLLPHRLADRQLRAPRLHHPGQVRAASRRRCDQTSARCKAHADSKLVNNLIFYVGRGYVPARRSSPTRPRAKRGLQRSTKDMPMLTTSKQAPESPTPGRARPGGDALPLAAQAQRKSPLADAPAIRKRYELRQTALRARRRRRVDGEPGLLSHGLRQREGSPSTSPTGCRSAASATSPWPTSSTGFQGKVVDSLADPPTDVHREPTPAEAKAGMQKITNILGAQLEFTPFTGSTRCSASCSRTTTSTVRRRRRR